VAYKLCVTPAEGTPFEYTVEKDSLIIGRSLRSDLVIDDRVISRQHARLFRDGNRLVLEDLGSHNATLLNGRKVDRPVVVVDGDIIRLAGNAILVNEITDSASHLSSGSLFTNAAQMLLDQASEELLSSEDHDILRQHADRLKLLNEVHAAVSGPITRPALLEMILDKVFENLRPEEGAIYLLGEQGMPYRAAIRRKPDELSDGFYSTTLVHEVLERGMAALVIDTHTDQRFLEAESINSAGVRSLVAAPLLDAEGTIGMIVLHSKNNVRKFSEEDLALLVSLASIAALRIRNLALIENAARHLRDANRALEAKVAERTNELLATNSELERLDDIVRTINRETELKTVLQAVIDQALLFFPQATKGAILLWRARRKAFEFAAANGFEISLPCMLSFNLEEAAERFTIDTEQIEEGIYLIRRAVPLAENEPGGGCSALCIAIISAGRLAGYLLLDNFTDPVAFAGLDAGKAARFRQHAVSALTKALLMQKLSEKNEQVTSSLRYAQHIQKAILPDLVRIRGAVPESFILFLPKDIVSGDFYWFNQRENCLFLAAVDCTGHGVPGAFMSMVGNTLLNEILREQQLMDPSAILAHLNEGVRHVLKQERGTSTSTDGMEMALCRIGPEPGALVFAGAARPLYLVTPGVKLREIRGDRCAIGGRQKEALRHFHNQEPAAAPGDMIYLTTDGYADQPDGKGHKYGIRNFKNLLERVASLPVKEQEAILASELTSFRVNAEQRDDITVIGVRLPDGKV